MPLKNTDIMYIYIYNLLNKWDETPSSLFSFVFVGFGGVPVDLGYRFLLLNNLLNLEPCAINS